MKKLLLILLFPVFAYGQGGWNNVGNALQRTSDGFKYRFSLGSQKGVWPVYGLAQTDSAEINNSTVGQTASYNIIGTGEIQHNFLGTTATLGQSLINAQPATSGTMVNVSPVLYLEGKYWNGSTSLPSGWAMFATPSASGGFITIGPSINGAQPSNTVTITASGTATFASLGIGRETLSGSNDAASGAGQTINMTTDIGATANNDLLSGINLNNTFSTATGLATVKNIVGGTGGTNGTYTGVAIIDNNLPSKNTSAIAFATVVVSGGAVTVVTPTTFGGRYTVNDVLTVASSAIGNVTGFTCQVATLHAYTGVTGVQALIGAGGLLYTPVAFVNAPANPRMGQISYFTDSSTNAWGGAISGGGSNPVLAIFNGTSWTVIGK